MNELMIFEGTEVEVFELNGEVMFNPYHVGACLELAESSVRNYLANMNNKQSALVKNSDVRDRDIRKLNNAGEKFLTKSGVFKLIFKSNKPNAEKFTDWVTDDVLPSIEKHGAYITDNKIEEILSNPDTIITLATQIKEERAKNKELANAIEEKNQLIGELQPKANYVDRILSAPGAVTTSQIAADYGISANRLNKILHKERIQRYVGKQWILYKKHMGQGYTKSETFTFTHADGRPDTRMRTKWTQKGRLMINEVLNSQGIYAEMDIPNSCRA